MSYVVSAIYLGGWLLMGWAWLTQRRVIRAQQEQIADLLDDLRLGSAVLDEQSALVREQTIRLHRLALHCMGPVPDPTPAEEATVTPLRISPN